MPARTTPFRALRAALSGAIALVILAGVALPLGFSMEPFQTAHAKDGGPGAGGPPDHSSAGGNGGGHGNGHGGLANSDHGDGDYGENKLGKLNAGNAAGAALINANANSTVGQITIYKQMVDDEDITDFEGAKEFLETFANKEVTNEVVEALNELLGIAFEGVPVE